jgi:3-isopropylmalate dehydrogenase
MDPDVRSHVVASLPGDGIGPEVVSVARDLVDLAGERYGFAIDWRDVPLGSDHYLRTGQVLPDEVLDDLRKTDAVLLGAVGSPAVPPGVLERGLLLRLRAELDLYVNLRPSRAPLNLVIVRENTEGLYAGAGGTVHRGTAFEIATEESLNTRAGIERCVRYAAELAASRAGTLTLVHKTNVLAHAGDLWQRVCREVTAEAGLTLEYAHVDAACVYLVSDPGRFDVIVTDNLFGDIISDLAAALTGGLGLAASGNLNPAKTGPSVFEPVHGSAPDIAGKNLANPCGAVLSAALMLGHLGETTAAAGLDAAVEAVLAAGGAATTGAWADLLAAEVAR